MFYEVFFVQAGYAQAKFAIKRQIKLCATKHERKIQIINGGAQVSTGMDRSIDSRPELVDGSVKIDRTINNDIKSIVPVQNTNPMNVPMMGFGMMPIAA